MPKFKKWFHGIFSGVLDSNDNSKTSGSPLPPGLPGLPTQRKYILTPSPSREEITDCLTPNDVFFAKLPRELRDQVYTAAFRDRTIHIDLKFTYPQLPNASRTFTHAQVNTNGGRNPDLQPRWAWWSSVYHRHPTAEASDDIYQSGSPRDIYKFFYSKEWPKECFLGIIGWLITCR